MQRILIVEDEPTLASHLANDIEKYGYEAKVVTDFDHVMDTFHTFSPHLVLLDINLPSFDGFYWCRQIRLVSTCPVIFLSARTGEMDQVMALENGGDDFITKPFHPPILLARIAAVLNLLGSHAWRVDRMRVLAQKTVFFPYGGSDCTD